MNWNQYLTNNELKVTFFVVMITLVGFSYRFVHKDHDRPEMSEKISEAISQPYQVIFDINTATAQELMTISGIGKTRAEAIIEFRDENKPISIEDVIDVHGIGPKTLENMRGYFYADND